MLHLVRRHRLIFQVCLGDSDSCPSPRYSKHQALSANHSTPLTSVCRQASHADRLRWSTWWHTGTLLLLLRACSPAGMEMPVRAAHAPDPYRGPESSDNSSTLDDCSSNQCCNYKCSLLYCAPMCIFSPALCTWWILGSFCFSFSHREDERSSLAGCWHSLARWPELLSLGVCPEPSLASLPVSSSTPNMTASTVIPV